MSKCFSEEKDIDQKSKASDFNQYVLDQIARQGYGNARFEVNSEEGLDLVEEFYTDKNSEEEHQQVEHVQAKSKVRAKSKPKLQQGQDFVQDIQKGLQGSVRAVN